MYSSHSTLTDMWTIMPSILSHEQSDYHKDCNGSETSDEEAQPPYPENWFYFISNGWNTLQDKY